VPYGFEIRLPSVIAGTPKEDFRTGLSAYSITPERD
jgi:hypothetical protein